MRVGRIAPEPENCVQNPFCRDKWELLFFSKLALIEVAYWQGLAVLHFSDKIWQFWPL